MKLIFDQNGTNIYHHAKHKVLHLKWKGPDCSQEYQQVLEALRRFTLELQIEGWLMDLSDCQTIQTERMQETVEFLARALTEGNLKKFARVSSQDQDYESGIMEKILKFKSMYKLNVEVGNFKTEPEALAWLFDADAATLVDPE